MTDFADLLAAAGVDPSNVKLLRHKPQRGDLYAAWETARGEFENYQSIQRRDRASYFRRRLWAACVALRDGRTVFVGMYEPGLPAPMTGDITSPFGRTPYEARLHDWYACKPLGLLSEYAGRVVVEWVAPRSWVQNAERGHPVQILDVPAVDAGPSAARNPPWTRDELILALDLYLAHERTPDHNSESVRELSQILTLLARRSGLHFEGTFRNANGVYMKMMNYRRFDPTVAASGQTGLVRGNKDEQVVWDAFAGDRSRLKAVAATIRAEVLSSDEPLPAADLDDGFVEAAEGRLLTVQHRTRERSRKLVEKRKQQEMKLRGKLQCEACDFDFASVYGDRGSGFIEAHHTKPVHSLGEGAKTRLEDLALVCSNCHRMIHSARPWLSLDELKNLLDGHASQSRLGS